MPTDDISEYVVDEAPSATNPSWVTYERRKHPGAILASLDKAAEGYLARSAADLRSRASTEETPPLLFRGNEISPSSKNRQDLPDTLCAALEACQPDEEGPLLWAAIVRYASLRGASGLSTLARFADVPFTHGTWQASFQAVETAFALVPPTPIGEYDLFGQRAYSVTVLLLNSDLLCDDRLAALAANSSIASLCLGRLSAVELAERIGAARTPVFARYLRTRCATRLNRWSTHPPTGIAVEFTSVVNRLQQLTKAL